MSHNILVEAKKEYTNQLIKILQPRIYEGFKSMFDDTISILGRELEENGRQTSSVIKTFQKMLKDIPHWNQDIINKEFQRITNQSKCDYIDDLIEAVFITNIKILTSVQIHSNDSVTLNVNVPSPVHFIHKCYIETAKEIYKNPYVFDNSKNLSAKEKHNNLRDCLQYIESSVDNAIRELLPIRDLLKQGLTKHQTGGSDINKPRREVSVETVESDEESEISESVSQQSDDEEISEQSVSLTENNEESEHNDIDQKLDSPEVKEILTENVFISEEPNHLMGGDDSQALEVSSQISEISNEEPSTTPSHLFENLSKTRVQGTKPISYDNVQQPESYQTPEYNNPVPQQSYESSIKEIHLGGSAAQSHNSLIASRQKYNFIEKVDENERIMGKQEVDIERYKNEILKKDVAAASLRKNNNVVKTITKNNLIRKKYLDVPRGPNTLYKKKYEEYLKNTEMQSSLESSRKHNETKDEIDLKSSDFSNLKITNDSILLEDASDYESDEMEFE